MIGTCTLREDPVLDTRIKIITLRCTRRAPVNSAAKEGNIDSCVLTEQKSRSEEFHFGDSLMCKSKLNSLLDLCKSKLNPLPYLCKSKLNSLPDMCKSNTPLHPSEFSNVRFNVPPTLGSFKFLLTWVQSDLVCVPTRENNIFHLVWKNSQK